MSAWGNSWGSSWLNSWGLIAQEEADLSGWASSQKVSYEEDDLLLFAQVIVQLIEEDYG